MVITYAIIQAECPNILPLLHAAEDFVNINQYEECAPLATVESAIKVIQFEYGEYLDTLEKEKKAEMKISIVSDDEEIIERINVDAESKASVGEFA